MRSIKWVFAILLILPSDLWAAYTTQGIVQVNYAVSYKAQADSAWDGLNEIWLDKDLSGTTDSLCFGDVMTSPVHLYSLVTTSTLGTSETFYVKHLDYWTSDPVTHIDYWTSDPVTHIDYWTSDPVTHVDYWTSDPVTHADSYTSMAAGWFVSAGLGWDSTSGVLTVTVGPHDCDVDLSSGESKNISGIEPTGAAVLYYNLRLPTRFGNRAAKLVSCKVGCVGDDGDYISTTTIVGVAQGGTAFTAASNTTTHSTTYEVLSGSVTLQEEVWYYLKIQTVYSDGDLTVYPIVSKLEND